MRRSLIPWHVFRTAVEDQPPIMREAWLRRWLFTNEGVIMAHQKDEAQQAIGNNIEAQPRRLLQKHLH
jgi:hypothetical protein